MFDVFGSVRGLLKFDHVRIDNNIFRLHYKGTVVILIAFSLLVTCRQYIGDPINCISDEIPMSVMESYCWIYSTFTLTNHLNAIVGVDVAAPGVASQVYGEDQVKYHKYYQWVCFVLFFQAILFYIPRYLWKTWEGGKIRMLVLDLDCQITSEETKSDQINLLVKYFSANLHKQNFYLYRFIICEVLNFINVFGQIYFMNFFLDGEFLSYGWDVITFTETLPEERNDAMSRVFPKITKCTFHKYGPSGSIQHFDALCVLPLNIVNEKIYVFLWFWFLTLTAMTGLSLIYRAVVIFSKQAREVLLRARSRHVPHNQIYDIVQEYSIGDWFVLYQLGSSIDPAIYKELIQNLSASGEERLIP